MRGDFSRDSFDERKHYTQVLLQQGRVQLDADWNEAAAIETRRDERAMQDVIGACGSPNEGFRIAARQTLDDMESTAGWSVVGTGAELCVDYIDRLRGTASLHVAKATEARKSLSVAMDLSGADDLLAFAVKSANPLSGAPDTGFTFFVADAANQQATWAVAALTPLTIGAWRVYTCPLASATTKAPGLQLRDVWTFGFTNLKADWSYHFDLIQRDFAPLSIPLQDILALDDIENVHGWSVPAASTGSVSLDAGRLFQGRSTVKITGPGDGVKSFGEARDLRAYRRIITVTNQAANPNFFLQSKTGAKIKLQNLTSTPATGWTTCVGDIPADPNLHQMVGYGFEVAAGASLNVAQVLAVLNSTGSFYILGGEPARPGRMYVDGIACQKDTTETYYSQVSYPEALPLNPIGNRVDLVYLDVWQRQVTSLEDPDLREVALGGPDTCTRVQTVAQVKVLQGAPDPSTVRLDCASIPTGLQATFQKLLATGSGTLSTLTTPPSTPDNLCEIAPDADFLGLDNRLYRVEIHAPGTVTQATFKWSQDNGAIAVAVVEDVVPATGSNPQVVQVQRLGRDRATSLAMNDWIEISDDFTDLADEAYDSNGLPRRRVGELRQVKAVDPDANTITLSAPPLAHSYTVIRHAKVRKWDGAGARTAAFVDTQTTPQLDLGDSVRITFDGGTAPMLTGDYWQFTARGATGQIERLNHALPAGIMHHFCPLALIKWQSNGAGGFEIVDVADCRHRFPALTAIQATDVSYDDSCCGLTDDVKTLAVAHGDPLDPQFKVANVQQALDALCARAAGLCTITVGDGKISHGQFNGPDGLQQALNMARNGGTVCVLRGTYPLERPIVLRDGRNIIVQGNRLETKLVAPQGDIAFRFMEIKGIELHDLIIQADNPRTALPVVDGVITFLHCLGVVVHGCSLSATLPSNIMGMGGVAGLLIATDKSPDPAFPPPLVRDCLVSGSGPGQFIGVALSKYDGAVVSNNRVQILGEGGGVGINLEDDCNGCILDGNTITGVHPDMPNGRHGSQGGIHIGSGCDKVTVSNNQIEGGAGYGIGLGSVNANGASLGEMRGLRIERNRIRGMALSGIGVLGFNAQFANTIDSPMTNEILVSANRIENCAYGEAKVIARALDSTGTNRSHIHLSGAVSLWMGNAMRLLDNDVVENGHCQMVENNQPIEVFAPHPVGGVFVYYAGPGLVLSRNRIWNNFSNKQVEVDDKEAFNVGIVVRSANSTGADQPAITISDNDVNSPAGPAMHCQASGAVHISGNRLAGQMTDITRVPVVKISAGGVSLLFNNNHVDSRLVAPPHPPSSPLTLDDSPVLLVALHVTFSTNHCVCPDQPPSSNHVRINCSSATVTGNHCLEKKSNNSLLSINIRSPIEGTIIAVAAVANVTTNGVDFLASNHMPNPPGDLTTVANLIGIQP